MKLQEAAAKEAARGNKNKIDRYLQALPKADAAFLDSLLRDGTRTHAAISRIMKDAEMPASEEAVKKWRTNNHVITL